ncbi:MAG: energy-coupling factor ABC transporter ATP-binding protein [Desulfobulbaceae bacterium]
MESFLHLQNIRHQYNGRLVLDIPELRITKGSITGLAGPNGSGKSTLLRVMGLMEISTSGTVLVDGVPAHAGNSGRGIILLPQEAYLLRRTVFDNIAYGLRLRKRMGELRTEVLEGLAMVGLGPAFAERRWHELSGGEAQRVALAARLVLRPACLLLDEPTASVDMKSGLLIQQAVLQAREQWGTTLVIASHHRSWLHDICDHLLFLYNGRLLDGSLDNLLPGPWSPATGELWQTRLADGQLLFASQPLKPDSSGILLPASLRLGNGEVATDEQTLRGTVTGIFIDKSLKGPCLQVNCGGQPLLATAARNDFKLDTCRPGQGVILHYRPEAITWLD